MRTARKRKQAGPDLLDMLADLDKPEEFVRKCPHGNAEVALNGWCLFDKERRMWYHGGDCGLDIIPGRERKNR